MGLKIICVSLLHPFICYNALRRKEGNQKEVRL